MPYAKPAGYRTIKAPAGYKVFNGYLSGSYAYSPIGPFGNYFAVYQFVAAPANGVTLSFPDGPASSPATPTKVLTFTYAGSPGAGVIPLVAGGGTAAQAAAAATLAINNQLTYWSATNPSPGFIRWQQKQRGVNNIVVIGGGTSNMNSITGGQSLFGALLPARFGRNYALLQGT